MKRLIGVLLLSTACVLAVQGDSVGGTEKELAESAEAQGKLQDALDHYTNALREAYANRWPTDDILSIHGKIFDVHSRLDATSTLPEAAVMHMQRGEAVLEAAKDQAGLEEAGDEFAQAMLIAPWNSRVYFDKAVVYERMGNYGPAVTGFRLYLLAAPDAKDADDVRAKIAELKRKLE